MPQVFSLREWLLGNDKTTQLFCRLFLNDWTPQGDTSTLADFIEPSYAGYQAQELICDFENTLERYTDTWGSCFPIRFEWEPGAPGDAFPRGYFIVALLGDGTEELVAAEMLESTLPEIAGPGGFGLVVYLDAMQLSLF